MKTAVITGSFNPVTSGHIYLLRQALQLFDKVYMVMLINPDKVYQITADERLELLKKSVEGFCGVEVAAYDGYACDFCKKVGAEIMIRGLRDSKDLAYELDLRKQNLDFGGIDTMFFLTDDNHRFVSSTEVRAHARREEE